MTRDPIFAPLKFRHLEVKNRLFRSSVSGRIDNYDGSGTQARINWEARFARGGVGAIISAHAPVDVRGRILPNYAFIDADDKIPFWREVGRAVHYHDCRFILQLSHSGRQQDIGGVENQMRTPLSSTNRPEGFHGFPARAMTRAEIDDVVARFAAGARRARSAGLDGVELHACNGYLITQFLSSAINDRQDEYGGPLENRARLLLDIIRAIRREVGSDFHLQVKISAEDHNNALNPLAPPGNTLEDSIRVCRWVEAAGADAIHVSSGSMFPHPRNPPGGFPLDVATHTYDTVLDSGSHTLRNYFFFRSPLLRPITRWLWGRTQGTVIEGINLPSAQAIKRAVGIPVICTGGFQDARLIRRALDEGLCDAVSIARPLIATPDLPKVYASGRDLPERPCTFCNRCLINVLENPLGCYEVSRFDGDYDRMIREVMSFFSELPEVGPARVSAPDPSDGRSERA
ncbi:MAG TPA: NADH:flavin oxidoreductase [Polyangia bacterium]|jgi:2,4-dienoyl-CoA reductase (NADPH2)|nr:NADH:flavin oxidoreductase [Polyangia bacterium]